MATRDELLAEREQVKAQLRQQLESERSQIQGQLEGAPEPESESFDLEGAIRDTTQSVAGAIDLGVTLMTGAVLEPLAGLSGIVEGVASAVRGDEDPLARSVERIEQVRGMSPFPVTPTGGEFMETVSVPFEMLNRAATSAGGAVQDVTGSPAAAAATQTAIEFAPGGVGIRPRPRRVREDIRRVEAEAGEVGVDLRGRPAERTEQIQDAARGEVGGRSTRGEALDDVRSSILNARQVARSERDRLYAEARASRAGVSVVEARGLEPVMRTSLEDFDVGTMPIVQRRLSELASLDRLPDNAVVKLNEIEKFRQRLIRNQPAQSDVAQRTALGIVKGQLDQFLEAQFNSDMIRGDPAAINKWREARAANQRYKGNFKDDRTIRQLAEQQATPEEMRRWVFGASVVGAKKQAGQTVSKLKTIIGENSPEFQALRQDALLDIMEPLLRDDPDLKQFTRNYDRFVRDNKTLADELFPESQTSLRKLRDFAGATESITTARQVVRLERLGAVALFGHGIAQAALKVRIAQFAFGLMRRSARTSRKRKVMGDILGYDALSPVVRPSAVGLPAAGQTAIAGEQPAQGEIPQPAAAIPGGA